MSTQVDQQPQDDPRTEQANAEPGSEDEAIAAFNQRRQSEAQTEQDPPADDPEEGATDPEADPEEGEAEPGEADPAGELVEVEFEGETFEVPPKLKDALLRKSDYSRSMNALDAVKKDYAQRVESIERREQGVEKVAKALAKVEAIEAQLEQFKSVDWDKLEEEDPARASILGLKAMRLQKAHADALTDAKSVDAELVAERNKDLESRQAEMVKTLDKEFPGGWGDDAGKRVSEYALKAGYTPQELRTLTDPRLVIALEKARKYDASKKGAEEAVAKAKKAGVPPVAKPGARVNANDKVRDLEGRFLKSKSPEAAEALFEARAARRR